MDPSKPDTQGRWIALDEFVSTQTILIETHKKTCAYTPGKIRDVFNPTFELVEWFQFYSNPTRTWTQIVYSVHVYVLNLGLLPVTLGFVSFQPVNVQELVALLIQLDPHRGLIDHTPALVSLQTTFVDPRPDLPRIGYT
jgi:hypothetical protein